eukprot:5361181-Karenia_brevis.AAC.1
MIISLNLLYVGGVPGAATSRATAAQRRAHERLMGLSRAFLSKNKCATAHGMKSFLKSGEAYFGRKTTLPLGVRCKVPEVAAQVDLAAVLSKLDPVMSRQ